MVGRTSMELYGWKFEQLAITGATNASLIHAKKAAASIAIACKEAKSGLVFLGAGLYSRCREANGMNGHISDVETLMNVSGFTLEDMEQIHHLSEYIVPRLPALADRFYERLLANEYVHPYLEWRIDQLKNTHVVWLVDFFLEIVDS